MAKEKSFIPMSAAKIKADENWDSNWAKVKWPKFVQAKVDGIRCVITEKGALTRSLKPIPNRHIAKLLSDAPVGLDGEIVTYDDNSKPDDFNTIQSKVMSEDGEPDFYLLAFDNFSLKSSDFEVRHQSLYSESMKHPLVAILVNYGKADSLEEAIAMRDELIQAGYEGCMLRDPKGPYKFGGSSLKEGYLIKMKVFEDAEAKIKGFEEEMENANEVVYDENGIRGRSGKAEGMIPKGSMGAMIVEWANGPEFKIGTGFDAKQRDEYWKNRDNLIGKTVTFSYQGIGSGGRPRFPTFIGLRPEHD
jgi:DNA ligase-1